MPQIRLQTLTFVGCSSAAVELLLLRNGLHDSMWDMLTVRKDLAWAEAECVAR